MSGPAAYSSQRIAPSAPCASTRRRARLSPKRWRTTSSGSDCARSTRPGFPDSCQPAIDGIERRVVVELRDRSTLLRRRPRDRACAQTRKIDADDQPRLRAPLRVGPRERRLRIEARPPHRERDDLGIARRRAERPRPRPAARAAPRRRPASSRSPHRIERSSGSTIASVSRACSAASGPVAPSSARCSHPIASPASRKTAAAIASRCAGPWARDSTGGAAGRQRRGRDGGAFCP